MYRILFLFIIVNVLSGCASSEYRYTTPNEESDRKTPPMEQQIIVGKPNAFLDSSDWIWPGSWLAKLVLWDKNVDSHTVSNEVVDDLKLYLEKNNLNNVQILVNTYKPGVQWHRLFKNKEINPVWRYSLGILSTSFYTLLPGRFFGGDHYNPYTNTLSLYSDESAIALHEAGHAKDFSRRENKGLNAAIYSLPGAALYYEAVATSDALTYLDDNCRYEDEKDAYQILHPAYGTYVGGLFLKESGLGFLMAIPGHVTGAFARLTVHDDKPCKSDNPEQHEESLDKI